jgi:hypothetical protein
MDKNAEFIASKMRECSSLKKKVKEQEEEIRWLKKVLELALGDRVIVVREEELNSMPDPIFDLAENLNDELLVRAIRRFDYGL